MAIITGGNVSEGTLGPYTSDGAPSAGTNEIQYLIFGGTHVAGSAFTLTVDGHTTSSISWSATNGTLVGNIDTALEALPVIGSGGVTTGSTGTLSSGIGTVTVTFTGDSVCRKPIGVMTLGTSGLLGTTPTLTASVQTAGVAATAKGASIGAICTDTTNGKAYINTGTPANPTWTVVGSQS